EKAVRFIPESGALVSHARHGLRDVEEMLEELRREILVDMVVNRQLQRHSHQVQCEHGHPTGAVRLTEVATRRQRLATVEYGDVVQPQESALEEVSASGVLPIYPPGEGQHLLLQDSLQEIKIA